MDLNLDVYFEQRASISEKIKKFESSIQKESEIKSTQSAQSETKSTQSAQSEIKPAQSTPSETKPAQSVIKPLESKAVHSRPKLPQLPQSETKLDNVTKIANKLKGNVDLTNKQPGMLGEEYKYTSIDFRKTYTAKELAEIWINSYAMFVMWIYYDIGFMGKFKEPSGYLHRSVTALVMMPIHSHDKRLALVGLLDLMNHVDMHIRHKHTNVIKIGMAIDIVERIVPDLVGILQKLGFDNRVVNLAKDLVELLKLVINMGAYEF